MMSITTGKASLRRERTGKAGRVPVDCAKLPFAARACGPGGSPGQAPSLGGLCAARLRAGLTGRRVRALATGPGDLAGLDAPGDPC